MRQTIFLTLDRNGVVKMTKEKVKLGMGQRAVKLNILVPDAAFAEPPILDAELDVPAKNLIAPEPEAPLKVEIWE